MRTQLQPPTCEVGHGRNAKEMPKALGQHRARNAHLPGQFGDGPRVGWLTMHQRERVADIRVARSGEPLSALFRSVFRNSLSFLPTSRPRISNAKLVLSPPKEHGRWGSSAIATTTASWVDQLDRYIWGRRTDEPLSLTTN